MIAHVAGSFFGVLYTIYLIDELHLSPFMLGVVVSAGGVGALIGSLFASRVIARLGIGPALIWAAVGGSLVGILTPLAGGPVALAALMVFIPQLVGDGLQTIEGVAELSLIQGVIPDRILGRVNATLEVFSHGIAYPLGALLAAAVAERHRGPRRDLHRLGRDGGLDPAPRVLAAPASPEGLRRAGARGLIASAPGMSSRGDLNRVRHDPANIAVALRCACPERVRDLLRACASERRGAPTA